MKLFTSDGSDEDSLEKSSQAKNGPLNFYNERNATEHALSSIGEADESQIVIGTDEMIGSPKVVKKTLRKGGFMD